MATTLHKTTRIFRLPAAPGAPAKRRRFRTGFPIRAVSRLGADGLRVTVQGADVESFDWIGAVPGVQILSIAGRNGPGFARLRTEGDGKSIAWRAPGSGTFGPAVAASADGELVLVDGEDRDKWVRVRVFFSFLPGFAAEREIALSDKFGNTVGGADVTSAQATAGLTTTTNFTLQNASPWAFHRVRAWVDPLTVSVNISDDGSTWIAPTTDGTSLLLADRLDPGATVVLYSQRVIGAGAYFDPRTLLGLHLAFGRA